MRSSGSGQQRARSACNAGTGALSLWTRSGATALRDEVARRRQRVRGPLTEAGAATYETDWKWSGMPEAFTKISLAAVDDAAPANGFGGRWEARVAREALAAERTGVTLFRLRPGKRSPFTHRHRDAEEIYVVLNGSGRIKLEDELVDVAPLDAIRVAPATARAFEAGQEGLEFLAFGPHHPGDGEPVEDPWTAK